MSGRESTKKVKKNETPQLKILMIHGYRQNELAFRERSGGMRKALKNHADFVFCEAPHVISDQKELEGGNERGWWFSSNQPNVYDAHEFTDIDSKFEESLQYLDGFFESSGPFDGILGFSQGACLAGILAKIAENNLNKTIDSKYKSIKFNFLIIVAGYKSRQSQHEGFYDINAKVSMPSLHVFGNGDQVIQSDMSDKLKDYFYSPSVFIHELGHFIPVNGESKTAFVKFLESVKSI